MLIVTLARHAMATRFEIVLHGENAVALRAAGEEALAEVERLERQLSLFVPTSEIAHVNARAAAGPVRVSPAVFALLQQAQQLHRESGGAFDITIAPLVRCWGFMTGNGQLPSPDALAAARACVGMDLVHLDSDTRTVQFAREGVMLDLGAIGKGHAIERAAEILREAGITSALLHAGTSTVYALGHPPEAEFWKVAIEAPPRATDFERIAGSLWGLTLAASEPGGIQPGNAADQRPETAPLLVVPLQDEALSVSGIWGKFFQAEDRTYGHVLDPRTGQPARTALLSAVVLPSATETDALSTALLVGGAAAWEQLTSARPQIKAVLLTETENGPKMTCLGLGSS